jgi:hypothetical protein
MVSPPDQGWVGRLMRASCEWLTAPWFDRSLKKVTHCREFFARRLSPPARMVAPIHVRSYGTAEQVAEVLP